MLTTDPKTLELLIKTSQSAVETKVLPVPNRPDQVIVARHDKHEVLTIAPYVPVPPLRKHKLFTLQSFVELFETYHPAGGTIWVNAADCQFFIDPAKRDEHAVLTLEASPLFSRLVDFVEEPTAFAHKAFLRLLRHDLAGAVSADLEGAFSALDIRKMAAVNSQITAQAQSLDRQVSGTVQGAEKPRVIIARGKVHANHDLATVGHVALGVEIDVDQQQAPFIVQAQPDSYETAIRTALAELVADLKNRLGDEARENTVILNGTP